MRLTNEDDEGTSATCLVAVAGEVLGYTNVLSIPAFERATNPREVPLHLAMLMQAFRDGWRPPGWPE